MLKSLVTLERRHRQNLAIDGLDLRSIAWDRLLQTFRGFVHTCVKYFHNITYNEISMFSISHGHNTVDPSDKQLVESDITARGLSRAIDACRSGISAVQFRLLM